MLSDCTGLIISGRSVFIFKVRALADRHGLSVHLDGARLMNAAVALGVPPATMLQHTHTVSVCLSKVGELNKHRMDQIIKLMHAFNKIQHVIKEHVQQNVKFT